MKTHKLAIIGVGHVGTQVLASALHSHLFSEIILIDPRTELATGEALEVQQNRPTSFFEQKRHRLLVQY